VAPRPELAVEDGAQAIVAAAAVLGYGVEHRAARQRGDSVLERAEVGRPAVEEPVDALELLAAARRVDVAQPIVQTEHRGVIDARNRALRERTIDAERARPRDARRELFVPRCEHAAVARRDVLHRIERKAAGVAEK